MFSKLAKNFIKVANPRVYNKSFYMTNWAMQNKFSNLGFVYSNKSYFSTESKGLTPGQLDIIKACVPVLAEHGETITKTFYKNMLNEHKELNNIFNQTHQLTGHQPKSLANAVYAYAKHIDNLGVLGPAVELMCQKHCALYIKPEQYAIVGTHLLAAIKQVLGDAATPEIIDAWAAAYWQLANIMIEREKQIYAENGEWQDWKDFVIDKKVKESDEITSFYLKPKDGKPLPIYKPGQFISIQIPVPELGYLQSRQYSLSTAPNGKYFRISVKKESGLSSASTAGAKNPGWISNILHAKFKEGDTVQLSHPQGDFFLDTKALSKGPVVLISAGVGITPLLCMLETLVAEKTGNKVSWVHATRSSEVQAFGPHVKELVQKIQGQWTVFQEKPKEGQPVDYHHKGRLDLDKLDQDKTLFLNDKSTVYYVCGPEQFMTLTSRKLKSLGVDAGRIHMELFGTGGVPQ